MVHTVSVLLFSTDWSISLLGSAMEWLLRRIAAEREGDQSISS